MVMTFADGSRATVCYGSSGHSGLPKERIEVAWDGKSVVIHDFVRMECHGIGKDENLRKQDKGVLAHFTNFFEALRGNADLVAPVSVGTDVATRIEEARRAIANLTPGKKYDHPSSPG